jgi:hypothetical protein
MYANDTRFREVFTGAYTSTVKEFEVFEMKDSKKTSKKMFRMVSLVKKMRRKDNEYMYSETIASGRFINNSNVALNWPDHFEKVILNENIMDPTLMSRESESRWKSISRVASSRSISPVGKAKRTEVDFGKGELSGIGFSSFHGMFTVLYIS